MPKTRRIVRVLVDNDIIVTGLPIPANVRLCRILPAIDRWDFGGHNWIFFEGPNFPEVHAGATVPEYSMVFECEDGKIIDIQFIPVE